MSTASPLLARIQQASKDALRSGDAATRRSLSALEAAAKARGKDAVDPGTKEAAPREPTDADVVAAIRDQIKKARETAENFAALAAKAEAAGGADEAASRGAAAAQARAEVALLEGFLPKAPGADDIAAALDDILAAIPGAGMKQMGEVMAKLGERFGSGLDRAVAAPVVKARLSGGK